eukprot:EG_transcript_7347
MDQFGQGCTTNDAAGSGIPYSTSHDLMAALQTSIVALTAEIDSALGPPPHPDAPPARPVPTSLAGPAEGSSYGASSEASCSEAPEYLPFRPSARTALQTFHRTHAAVSETGRRRRPRPETGTGAAEQLVLALAATQDSNVALQRELRRVRAEMAQLREQCRVASTQLASSTVQSPSDEALRSRLGQLQFENDVLKDRLCVLSSLASAPKSPPLAPQGFGGATEPRRLSTVPEVVQLNVQRPSVVSVTHLSPDDFECLRRRRCSRQSADFGCGGPWWATAPETDRRSPSSSTPSPCSIIGYCGGAHIDSPPKYDGRRVSLSPSASPYSFPSHSPPTHDPTHYPQHSSSKASRAAPVRHPRPHPSLAVLRAGLHVTKLSASGSYHRRWLTLLEEPWRLQWTSSRGSGAATVVDFESVRCVAYNSLSGRTCDLAQQHLRFSFLAGRKVHEFCCPSREALLAILTALHCLVCPGGVPPSPGRLLWRLALRLTGLPLGRRPVAFRRHSPLALPS